MAFVWNRSIEKMRGMVPEELILHDLSHCASRWALGSLGSKACKTIHLGLYIYIYIYIYIYSTV